MLIDVGGKEFVMAKDSSSDTALHTMIYASIHTCSYQPINEIKVILEAADTDEILRVKNNAGKTPLQIATVGTVSLFDIKDLLGLPRLYTSIHNTVHSNDKTTTETSNRHRHQITPNKQSIASRTRASSSPLEQTIRNLQMQLKQGQDRATKIQEHSTNIHRDFDEKCADNINLEGALLQKGERVEKLQSKVHTLEQQKIKNEQDNGFYKRYADNLAIICSEQKIKLEEMEDAANSNAIESAGRGEKRKHSHEEHAFASNVDGTNIEGHAGEDKNMEDKIMRQFLFEREEHSKVRC